MRYLIDGHNLIGQLAILSLSDPDDEAKLVLLLRQFAAGRKARITVVFDHGQPGGWSPLSGGPIEAVFAGSHTNADRVIRERIRTDKQPGQLTLVSSDREVISAGKARKLIIARSEEFARQLAAIHEASVRPRPRTAADPDGKPTVGKDDLEEWLRLFGAGDDDPNRR